MHTESTRNPIAVTSDRLKRRSRNRARLLRSGVRSGVVALAVAGVVTLSTTAEASPVVRVGYTERLLRSPRARRRPWWLRRVWAACWVMMHGPFDVRRHLCERRVEHRGHPVAEFGGKVVGMRRTVRFLPTNRDSPNGLSTALHGELPVVVS